MSNYRDTYSYERFITRAFKCSPLEHGANHSKLENLFIAEERGDNDHFLDLLGKINDNLTEAIDQFLTFNLTGTERNQLEALQKQLNKACTPAEILALCIIGDDLTSGL